MTSIQQEVATTTAPIALFVYNRRLHTQRTVEALSANALAKSSRLFIFSDAPKNSNAKPAVDSVRDYLRSITGFLSVTIIERTHNMGVDASVIDGVTKLCMEYGHVIVLEDDLVTSKSFLQFMNQALCRYAADPGVMQISGYNFPVKGFDPAAAGFMALTSAWGWATWKRAWIQFDPNATGYEALRRDRSQRRKFDLNGAYDYFRLLKSVVSGAMTAWDVRWYLSCFMKGGLTLFPQSSLVMNIGFDGSGEHCAASSFPGSDISDVEITKFPAVALDARLQAAVEDYLRSRRERGVKSSLKRILGWLT